MPFTSAAYAATRPSLYHLTAKENLDGIAPGMRLDSAAALLQLAGRGSAIRQKRFRAEWVSVGGRSIQLRDQAPLYPRNAKLTDGWLFEDLLQHLNEHVFFWPGSLTGPVDAGLRHIQRYQRLTPGRLAILRTKFEDVCRANPTTRPLFCRFNSGSPRWAHGEPSPRGPSVFQPASEFSHPPAQVVEVVFASRVSLPADTEWAETLNGPWKQLCSAL